jgi:hypothetical protein
MSTLTYVKPERISLKKHPAFNEQWLQDRIAEDPAILGIGDVEVIDRERRQERAGRLDLLLQDTEENLRYEVELQLGPTDESHIIRCIEYWDIERRRWPGHEHCAVLVAEDVTSRFLNVLQLFAGSIPFVGIQLNALKVGEQIVLNFVKVVDQRLLRQDEESQDRATPANREYWHDRRPKEIVDAADEILALINERASHPFQLNFTRSIIGLSNGTRVQNFIVFRPRKGFLRLGARISEASAWVDRLEEAGLAATVNAQGRLRVNLKPQEIRLHRDLLRELVGTAVKEHEGR